jgi:hypothetical protein
MDNYYNKYLKYKDKYLKLKNMPNMIGGSEIAHILCTTREDNTIFLTLLLQLLIEYEFMFDFKQDQESNTTSPISQNIYSPRSQKPLKQQHEKEANLMDEDGTDDEIEKTKNNIFLSIFKFYTYNNESIYSLLESKEQINDTIKTISNYCPTNIKNICNTYREELYCNKDIIQSKCSSELYSSINSFYDSRNYSIMVLFRTLLGLYDDEYYPPILVHITDNGIIIGHIFIHYINRPGLACLEAVSIQSSLRTLIGSLCYNEKRGISRELFEYVNTSIVPLFPYVTYIYAYAWKVMSDILKKDFAFITLTYDSVHGRNTKTFKINNIPIDIRTINQQSTDYQIYHNFKDDATLSGDLYIFTIKKIEH